MPDDRERALEAARPVEQQVLGALRAHPEVSHLSDFTQEMDGLDFRFRFERQEVHLDVKAKLQRPPDDIAELWPEVPREELLAINETSFRALVWNEGLGYLIVDDQPRQRWHIFGPWELCLGPRRRYEHREVRTTTEFSKGRLLLDLRTASRSTDDLDIDALLEVVRRSRTSLRTVRAIPVSKGERLPILPRRSEPPESGPEVELRPEALVSAGPPMREAHPDWAGLSEELVDAVRSRWGWDRPTPAQSGAIPPILQGRNVLVLAPTAGGKTEAALLPLLDLHRRQGWGSQRPSVLVISPLKALIDDQLDRWRKGTALVGATAAAWHGDVEQEVKWAIKGDPRDVLLTTPESLELFLTSPGHDERALFAGLRAVVIDEVHAFVGTPRGAQLASLLERLNQFVDADFQRIGLSATVGGPEHVLDWVRGGSLRENQLVAGIAPMQGEDVSISSYHGLEECGQVIDDAVRDHRALVFARSRRRAEELAHLLGVPTHHSSVSAPDRENAVQRPSFRFHPVCRSDRQPRDGDRHR